MCLWKSNFFESIKLWKQNLALKLSLDYANDFFQPFLETYIFKIHKFFDTNFSKQKENWQQLETVNLNNWRIVKNQLIIFVCFFLCCDFKNKLLIDVLKLITQIHKLTYDMKKKVDSFRQWIIRETKWLVCENNK